MLGFNDWQVVDTGIYCSWEVFYSGWFYASHKWFKHLRIFIRDLSSSLVLIGLSKTLIFYFFQGFLTSIRHF